MSKIVVIGAGAAGMIAAGKAAENAEKVIIIEQNSFFGKKLNSRQEASYNGKRSV